MAYCPECGAELPESARFCPSCARPTAAAARAEPPAAETATEGEAGRRDLRRQWREMPAAGKGCLVLFVIGALIALAALVGSTDKTKQEGGVTSNQPTQDSTDTAEQAEPELTVLSQDEPYDDILTSSSGESWGVTVTVPDVQAGWRSDNQFMTPTEGRFVTVLARVKNGGPDVLSVNPFDFRLEDEDGVSYQPSNERDPSFDVRDLNPGDQLSGWLTFDVPTGGAWKLRWTGPSTRALAAWHLEV